MENLEMKVEERTAPKSVRTPTPQEPVETQGGALKRLLEEINAKLDAQLEHAGIDPDEVVRSMDEAV